MNLNNLSKKISIKDNNKSLKNSNSSTTKEIFNNFFITKVNNPQKTPNLKTAISNKNVLLDKTKLLEKYKIKEKEDENLKHNFIEFIGGNTHYLDVEKLDGFFRKEEEKQKHRYDENLKIIEKKKKLLQDLNSQINKVIIESYKINVKDIQSTYDEKINEKKHEIRLKQHELEMYHQLFGRIYKVNYKLKNRLETEYKYQSFYNQQHEKYSIIKNTTLYKLQRQEKLLNNLNQYFEKFMATNEEIVGEKSKQLNKAEFEILLIKNDIINIENTMKNLKERISELEEKIEKSEDNYESKKFDLNSSTKSYLGHFVKMEGIYQVLNVENERQILHKFTSLKQEYNDKSYKIKLKSTTIMNLTSELKKKNELLKNIFVQINLAKKALMSKKGNETEERIILEKSQIKLLVAQVYDVLKEKISIFTQCVNNALSNISKITESMKNATIRPPFTFDNKFIDKYNFMLSDDLKSLNVDLEKELDEKIMLKFVVILIVSLYKFLAYININVSYYLYTRILKEIKEKQYRTMVETPQSSKNLLKYSFEIENNEMKIFYLKSQYLQSYYDKELNFTISRLNDKKKIYRRTPKDIFKQIYNDKSTKGSYNISDLSNKLLNSPKSKVQNETDEISSNRDSGKDSKSKKTKNDKVLLNRNNTLMPKDDFMKMYFTFYKNSLKEKKNLNRSLPKLNYTSLSSHRFSFINQFINGNVSEKLSQDKKKKIEQERIKAKSKAITTKIKEKELIDFINKMHKNEGKLKNIEGFETKSEDFFGKEKDNDISLDQEKKEQQQRLYLIRKQLEESKKRKKYKLKSNEPEMNLISERLDDLRALELYFSKGNQKQVIDSSVFNEYYFKIKRILKNAQNKLRNSIVSNSVQTGFKKLNKSTRHNVKNIIRRNNSEDFEENNIRRMGKFHTSKAQDLNFSTKDKTRQSYFRLSFYNKSFKREGTSINFNKNKIINEGNKADDN